MAASGDGGSGRHDSGESWLERPTHKAVASLVVAVLLGFGAWTAIGHAANFSKLVHAVDHAAAGWLVLCAVGAAAGYLGYAVMYKAVIAVDAGPQPSPSVVLRLTIGAFAASVLATSAGRVGFEYWSLRRMRMDPARSWSRVLALNTWEWAVLSAVAWLGAVALLAGVGEGAPLGVEVPWLLAFPVCLVPALYLSSPRRAQLTEPRGGPVRRAFAAAIGGIMLLRALVAGSRTDLIRGWGGAILHWGGDLLILWGALRVFGVEIGPAALVVGYATGFVSTMVPLPVGGAGGVDAAMTFGLLLVGVPLGAALLATVVLRIFTYWLPLVVALAGAGWLRSLPRELRALASRGRGHATARLLPAGGSG